jgi:translation elongation factor EF-Tu-like GTPase
MRTGMPYVEVEVQFSSSDSGGRLTPAYLDDQGYRPHFRIGEGELLGVEFVDGPDDPVAPGNGSYATVRFSYWPGVNYDALVEGATFDIIEGPKVVGHGRVVQHLK